RGAGARQRSQSPVRHLVPSHPAAPDEGVPSRTRTWTSLSASVTHCLPVVSRVTRAQALATLGINGDALAIAPVRTPIARYLFPELNLVSQLAQRFHSVGRKPLFYIHDIREPLMMKARRVHCFLNIHS